MRPEKIEYNNGLPVKASVRCIEQCPYHWHEALEIVQVLKGSVNIAMGDDEMPLKQGDIAITICWAWLKNHAQHIFACLYFSLHFMGLMRLREVRKQVLYFGSVLPSFFFSMLLSANAPFLICNARRHEPLHGELRL